MHTHLKVTINLTSNWKITAEPINFYIHYIVLKCQFSLSCFKSKYTGPKEGHKDDQRDGTPLLCGKAGSWGCSAWRIEGFRETLLQPFSI